MAISRRAFLQAVGATAVVAPSMVRAISPEERRLPKNSTACTASGKKPNVILILCDDLGWGDLGEFWQNQRKVDDTLKIHTPKMDQAMRDGIMLTNAYTTAPVCAPARASMVTGKNQGHCNLRHNMFDRPIDKHMTIGTVMKQAGYDTWHLGKWGIGGGYATKSNNRIAMACDAGFDYSYGYPAHNHGHTYYHCEGLGMDANTGTSSTGCSPIVENVSAAAYATGRYANLSEGAETNGTFALDGSSGATYYRRLVSNKEVQFCYDTDLFTAKLKQLINQQLTDTYKDRPFFAYACYTTVHGTGNSTNTVHALDKDVSTRTHLHVPPSGLKYGTNETGEAVVDTTKDYFDLKTVAEDADYCGGVTFDKDANGYLAFKGTAATANNQIYSKYTETTPEGGSRKRYATAIQRLDDAIGDLRNFLKQRGIANNTLIIFTSDNGPAGEYLALNNTTSNGGIGWVNNGFDSNADFKGMKRWSYEGGVREPTFAVWPNTIPASTETTSVGAVIPRGSNLPFQFPAWMATLADVAGLPQPAHCDGVSLLPTLTGSGTQLPARIYCEYEDEGSGQGFGFEQMVRDGNYVLIRNRSKNGGAVELYNVATDEGQAQNLASQSPDRVRWMSNLLLTCRMPGAKIGTDYYGGDKSVDSEALPSIAQVGSLPDWEVRIYDDNASSPWPWVPNFRTMYPDDAFLDSGKSLATVVSGLANKSGAYGLAIRGWIDVPTTKEVSFKAKGVGGCQLWIHEAHALEWEAGDCTRGKSVTLKLAKGRHPFRLYLTTTTGTDGLCSVTGLS